MTLFLVGICAGILLGLIFGPAQSRLDNSYQQGWMDAMFEKDNSDAD